MIKVKKQKLKSVSGFTIIELVVVMAIFLFVIGAALVIFISVIQHQKRVLAETQFLNQISYIEEYMSKALRMAKAESGDNCLIDWHSAGHLDHPGYIYLLTRYDSYLGAFKGIKFINQSDGNACQEFFLDNTTDPAHPVLKELKNSDSDNDAIALTSTSLQINSMKFSVNGSDGSAAAAICHENPTEDCGASYEDPAQPRATIRLNVKIAGDNQTRIIQTTVSQRNLNIDNGQRQQ